MGLEGAGDQNVLPRRQLEAVRDFPQVDEGLASGQGSVIPEEVSAQVSVLLRALQWKQGTPGAAAFSSSDTVRAWM